LFILGSAAAMDAEQAARFHLVDAILEPTPETSVVDHAISFLEPLLRHVSQAGSVNDIPLRALKRLLLRLSSVGADPLEAEHEEFCRLWGTEAQLSRASQR